MIKVLAIVWLSWLTLGWRGGLRQCLWSGVVVNIYQKVGVLKFSGYQDLEKDSPADCRASVQIFRKSTASSVQTVGQVITLTPFLAGSYEFDSPFNHVFCGFGENLLGWTVGVWSESVVTSHGSMYNQSQSCPHFWHKIRHVFSGCWAPPGLNFISNPICHIHWQLRWFRY